MHTFAARRMAFALTFAAWLGLGAPANVAAQEAEPASPAPASSQLGNVGDLARQIEVAPEGEAATLRYANRAITEMRARVLGAGPVARAASAVNRLDGLVERGGPLELSTIVLEDVVLILVDGVNVLAITRADLDRLGSESLDERVETALAALRLALDETHELRTPALLVRAAVRSAGMTLVTVILLVLLARLRRRLERPLRFATERAAGDGVVGRVVGQLSDRLQRFGRRVIVLSLGLVSLALLIAWLAFVLRQFPYTRPWGEAMRSYLFGMVTWVLGGLATAAPGLFTVLVVLVLTRLVVRGVNALFQAAEEGRLELPGLDAEAARPTRRLVTAVIWLFALVVAYPYLPGSGTEAFRGLSVMVGLVISIGSTGVVNQAMSGLMVMYSKTLRNGDFVRIGEVEGVVMQLGMLSTKVRTLQRQEVTVPNAVVISQATTNFTRLAAADGVGIETRVSIGYDTPWRQMHAILLLAAERTEGIRPDPKPFVLQTALDDFYVQYRLLAWVGRPEERPFVLSRLHGEILDLCNEHGVQIMSPHYEGDPASAKVVPQGAWAPAPAKDHGS